jgi:putative transposase
MILPPVSYKRHRFPPQIIAHAIWLYFRFPLSLRLVEEICLSAALSYPTKPFDAGRSNSAPTTSVA